MEWELSTPGESGDFRLVPAMRIRESDTETKKVPKDYFVPPRVPRACSTSTF